MLCSSLHAVVPSAECQEGTPAQLPKKSQPYPKHVDDKKATTGCGTNVFLCLELSMDTSHHMKNISKSHPTTRRGRASAPWLSIGRVLGIVTSILNVAFCSPHHSEGVEANEGTEGNSNKTPNKSQKRGCRRQGRLGCAGAAASLGDGCAALADHCLGCGPPIRLVGPGKGAVGIDPTNSQRCKDKCKEVEVSSFCSFEYAVMPLTLTIQSPGRIGV